MLQGENNASHLQSLQSRIEVDGDGLLSFYLIKLIGMMSALRGVETQNGSLFMAQTNASTVLMTMQCVKQLTTASPHAIYWACMLADGHS
jgi:hypothetical protein